MPLTRRAKALWATALLGPLILAGALVRVVRVEGDGPGGTAWLWAWQGGRVEFVNSVTGRPVAIGFSLSWRLARFWASTDPGTEEYYTAGAYAWNDRLARERVREIRYCSEVGVSLILGQRVFRAQGGCLRARLIWPP